MKKQIILMVGLWLVVAGLSACSGGAVAANEAPASGVLNADYENALPVQLQLAVGIFALDGIDNAIDAQAAAELLPLWKAVRSLSESESVAPEEIEAVFKQIEETMDPEQVQAIAAMQLTGADMTRLAQEMGLNFGAGGRLGEMTPEMQATIEAARESGDFPPGGFAGGGPEGGGVPGGAFPGGGPGAGGLQGGGLTTEQQATLQARRASNTGANLAISPVVLDAVIEYLNSTIQRSGE
jgi:hypothetical protein